MNFPPGTIVVVPWDFSDHSRFALEFALGEVPDETVYVICVLELPNPYAPDFALPWNAEENAISACEQQFRKEISVNRYPRLRFRAVTGDPATEIVRFAKHKNASLIVMSTHGRTGVSRILMGSVAENVLRLSSCPVLILPKSMVNQQQDGASHSQLP